MSTEGWGTRVGNELLAFVGEHERIRPLRDQIIVEPLDFTPSAIIPIVYRGKTLRGIVRAIGPGCFLKQYASGHPPHWHPTHHPPPKGDRTASRDSKIFRKTDAKIGDIVELGGLEIGGFLNATIRWGSKEMVVCREEDVAIVCEDLRMSA